MNKNQSPLLSYLCPPGNGVYTVHTAKERKEKLQHELYPKGDIDQSWLQSVEEKLSRETLNSQEEITLLGVCSDTGGGILRGANWGPLFIRSELLQTGVYSQMKDQLTDFGDIRVIPHLLHDKYLNEATLKNCRRALFQEDDDNLKVSPLSITETVCDLIYENRAKTHIMAFGGDHSVSYPLVKSYLQSAKKRGVKAALIHFDAHTDLLQERLGIDLCFASWTTHVLPYMDSPDLVHQIGIRSSGQRKEHWESTYGIHQHWATEIKDKGAQSVVDSICKDLKNKNIEELYISFDIDALDSQYAPATGTPEANGLAPHEASLMIEKLCSEFSLGSADMVEVAPFLETEDAKPHGREMTVKVAASLTTLMIEKMRGGSIGDH